MDLDALRRSLLDARDERASLLAAVTSRAIVFLSLNVPGPDKNSPRFDRILSRGRAAVLRAVRNGEPLAEGRDALGPYALVATSSSAVEAKRACARLEESLPFGRLLDLDVFGPEGRQVDRASLGLPPRRCLACDSAAVDCIRSQRHALPELISAVDRLAREPLAALARSLVNGARAELDLTPKPGLVDRADNGSHPDLSWELMSRAIDELPWYYEELIALGEAGDPDLAACAAAGIRAEARMAAAAGSNTHRGYLFLSGLLLLAAAADTTGTDCGWREQIRALAGCLVGRHGSPAGSSHGEEARRRHGVRGVRGEALGGLPSVFDHGLPAFRRGLLAFGAREAAQHYLMAVLMTTVEDTTAIHRCGPAGLARLKADGAALAALLEGNGDHLARLRSLNGEYRAMRLTMGGVADCLALTLAVHEAGPWEASPAIPGP